VGEDDLKGLSSSGIRKQLLMASDPGTKSILHMPCFNHRINLVFAHCLTERCFRERLVELGTIVRALRSDTVVMAMGRECPGPVVMRRVHIIDALQFILAHREDASPHFPVKILNSKSREKREMRGEE
jgi:hypothetical protein